MMMEDRRRSARDRRKAGRVRSVFAVRSTVGGRVQLGQTEDVGPAGMTLRRPRGVVLRPMTPVLLTFELPGTAVEMAVMGMVVSDTGAGGFRRTGVQFTRLAAEHESLLRDHCARAAGAWAAQDQAVASGP